MSIKKAKRYKLEEYCTIIELYTDYRVEAIVTKDEIPEILIIDRKSEFDSFHPKINRVSNNYHVPHILMEIYRRATYAIALKFKDSPYETQEERWKLHDEIESEIMRNNNWLNQYNTWHKLTLDTVEELKIIKECK